MSDESAEHPPEPPAEEEPDTFPREVVERLRQEAAERRTAARTAEERAERLQERLVAAGVALHARGALEDPTDLLAHVDAAELVDDDGAPDAERIRAAAAALVERKPHLGPRRPTGNVDQGARTAAPPPFDLSEVLRQAAR